MCSRRPIPSFHVVARARSLSRARRLWVGGGVGQCVQKRRFDVSRGAGVRAAAEWLSVAFENRVPRARHHGGLSTHTHRHVSVFGELCSPWPGRRDGRRNGGQGAHRGPDSPVPPSVPPTKKRRVAEPALRSHFLWLAVRPSPDAEYLLCAGPSFLGKLRLQAKRLARPRASRRHRRRCSWSPRAQPEAARKPLEGQRAYWVGGWSGRPQAALSAWIRRCEPPTLFHCPCWVLSFPGNPSSPGPTTRDWLDQTGRRGSSPHCLLVVLASFSGTTRQAPAAGGRPHGA